MPKNRIIGKNKRAGSNKKTGRVYGAKDASNNKKNQKKRVELNAEARKRKIYGKRAKAGKDLSHTKSGKMVLEARSKNRARNGSNGKSTKK